MKAIFWGTRGSVPAPLTAAKVREKVHTAIAKALAAGLRIGDDIDRFIDDALTFDERATFGGNTSCVEVQHGPQRLILDMGSGLRELGANLLATRSGDEPLSIDILMSHVHWDHIQGFPFFAPAYVAGTEIRIWTCHEDVDVTIRQQHSAPTFPVDYGNLPAQISYHHIQPETDVTIAGFKVTARKQHHHGDSYGYRLEMDGKSIVYATDIEHQADQTAEVDACARFFKNADLVIFDAMFAWGETQSIRQDWGHSSNVVGVDLSRLAQVRHLCLFHHDPANSDAKLQQSFEQTVRYAELAGDPYPLKLTTAYDGLVIAV